MNLLDFYKTNIAKDEYHYRFYDEINTINQVYNVFEGYREVNDYSFEVYDIEETIAKFRGLCQPEVNFGKENKVWFYLVTYYLFKMGYEIKEFPHLLPRPPIDPSDFTYGQIRDKIIAEGNDDNGSVRYAARRVFVSRLSFRLVSDHIGLIDAIEQKFIEISNRNASFDEMSSEEKLAEIANLIENLLKKNGKFIIPDYKTVCFEYITDEMITAYRKRIQCFRHSATEAISERKAFSDKQLNFLIDYGLTIVKAIHSCLN